MTSQVEHTRIADRQRTTTVRDVTYDLLRAYGLTTIFGNLGSTEQPFLAELPLGLPVHPRAPGGLGRRDGRRLRAGDARAGARQPPHRRRPRERDGQPPHRVPEQDAAHHHLRSADARDAAARAVSHERRADHVAAPVGQVGVSARAGAGRAGRVHARDRDGPPAACRAGVPLAAARRLGQAGRRAGRRADRRHAGRAGSRAPARSSPTRSARVLARS